MLELRRVADYIGHQWDVWHDERIVGSVSVSRRYLLVVCDGRTLSTTEVDGMDVLGSPEFDIRIGAACEEIRGELIRRGRWAPRLWKIL